MRFLVLSSILLCALAAAAAAQIAPPRAAIVKKSEFASEEGGFKAAFPGRPTRSVKTVDAAFGKADYVTFQHASPFALHMVSYIDFPSPMKDREELRVRFDIIKSSLTENQKARLLEEREIFFGEHLGRDYVFEIENLTMTVRCLVVEQRLFQLTVSTRGTITKGGAAVKSFHVKTAEDFFNSFAVTKLPAPKQAVTELPADFGVKIDGENFRSDYFKFSMTLPKNWTLADEEQTEYIKALGLEDAKTATPDRSKELDFSLQNTKILATLLKFDDTRGAVLLIAAERVSFPNFLPSAVTDNYVKRYLDPDEKVTVKTTPAKIGGADFAWIETKKTSDGTRQRLYVTNRGGIALQFFLSFTDEADLQMQLKALESVQFDDAAPTAK